MGVLSYWPLVFLLLIPAIILLYILKQEAKPQKFSSTMLWQEVYRNLEATRPWEKLRKNLLLFLQILTVLLLIFAMMGPWLRSAGRSGEQVVLVLDNSASMGTLYDGEQTRLEAAKEAACDYVDELPAGSVLHVISGNRQAVLVLTGSSDRTEANLRIRGIEQTELAGDLSSTLGLVQSCAGQSENGEIIFFTDTAFDMGDLEARVESFYSEAANIALNSLSYARKDDRLLVLIQLSNYSDEPYRGEINLYGVDENGKEELLEIAEAEVKAGETGSVYVETDAQKADTGVRILRAELQEQDALAGDNEAFCVLEEVKKRKVLLLTESNLFLEKAFSNLAGIELYRTDDVGLVTESEYDLYIFDGMMPEELPSSGSFLFINAQWEEYFKNCGKVTGQLLHFVDSEVTSYMQEGEIGVNESLIYELPSWGISYLNPSESAEVSNGFAVSAGFYGVYDGHRIAVMGFDLHQTDFGLKAEFPILMSAFSDYLLNGSLTEKNSYVVGDSIMLHGSTKGSELTLKLPDGSTRILDASEASGSYLEVEQTGIYHVSQELDGEQKEQDFTAAFPAASESHVEPADNMEAAAPDKTDGNRGIGTMELRNYILILLLILLIAEWIVYIRSR
ncbi:MAG: BatA domain-containing protein [Lachnospiraceae bacterium]